MSQDKAPGVEIVIGKSSAECSVNGQDVSQLIHSCTIEAGAGKLTRVTLTVLGKNARVRLVEALREVGIAEVGIAEKASES